MGQVAVTCASSEEDFCSVALLSLEGAFVILLGETRIFDRGALACTIAEALLALVFAVLLSIALRRRNLRESRKRQSILEKSYCPELALLARPLASLSRLLGLPRSPALKIGEQSRGFASVANDYGTMDGVVVIFGPVSLRLGVGMRGLTAVLAHELGHIFLKTDLWNSYLKPLVAVVSLGLLTTPILACAWKLYKLDVDAGAVIIAALTLSLLWFAVYKLASACVSRIHEQGCDDISTLCVGAGALAGVLIKHEAARLARGNGRPSSLKRYSPARLFASHPHLLERVDRDRKVMVDIFEPMQEIAVEVERSLV